MSTTARPFVIIGTPGDRRVTLFQEALARLDLPPASVIAYADLLENRVDLDAAIPRDAIVRIESPGKSWEVNRALALWGKTLFRHITFPSLEELGDYLPSWAWYRGFCMCLEPLEIQARRSDLIWMQAIRDIRLMFDKWASRERLHQMNIPIPLGPSGSYFVKSRYGSSGTGMAAIQTRTHRDRFEMRIYTTLALHEDRLINTRHIRLFTSGYDAFADPALHIWRQYESDGSRMKPLVDDRYRSEPWIPKATVSGGGFDLRIVMIAGRMRHIVVRVSESPITNLHLLNKRGDFEEVRRRISDRLWREIEETCGRVAALFPTSLYMGIDLLISSSWNKHYVLEVNAFGDLLPNLLHEGDDTYTAEIKEILKKG